MQPTLMARTADAQLYRAKQSFAHLAGIKILVA
jgi:hypothetical protein